MWAQYTHRMTPYYNEKQLHILQPKCDSSVCMHDNSVKCPAGQKDHGRVCFHQYLSRPSEPFSK